MNEKGEWLSKVTGQSLNLITFFPCAAKNAMDFDDAESLIKDIHHNMNDQQGLICVKNGITKEGNKYIYSIVKTCSDSLEGVFYWVRMNFQYAKKIYELNGQFSELNISGIRESVMLSRLMSLGIVQWEDEKVEGWFKDLYDESYTGGVLMNLAESEEYDELFPDHPLSQARELIRYITDTPQSKKRSLDEQLTQAIKQYNDTYTAFSDTALQLYFQRVRSIDLVVYIEKLVNSIANHPKDLDTTLTRISQRKDAFKSAEEFDVEQLTEAKQESMVAAGGIAAGAAITALAPSAAMWAATTFGTASTGTAISALSGAAATNAALAWLGGGALGAGGMGMAGGNALLALAGPVGWSVAGFSVLTSVILFANSKIKMNKKKEEEIESVKMNTHNLQKNIAVLNDYRKKTDSLRCSLSELYLDCLSLYNSEYTVLSENQKYQLGTLVNNANSLSALVNKTLDEED